MSVAVPGEAPTLGVHATAPAAPSGAYLNATRLVAAVPAVLAAHTPSARRVTAVPVHPAVVYNDSVPAQVAVSPQLQAGHATIALVPTRSCVANGATHAPAVSMHSLNGVLQMSPWHDAIAGSHNVNERLRASTFVPAEGVHDPPVGPGAVALA